MKESITEEKGSSVSQQDVSLLSFALRGILPASRQFDRVGFGTISSELQAKCENEGITTRKFGFLWERGTILALYRRIAGYEIGVIHRFV